MSGKSVLVALLALAACGSPPSDSPDAAPSGGGAPGIEPETGGLAGLENTAWLAQDLGGGPVTEQSMITLAFDDQGQVFGSGGCNRYTGSYSREGDALHLGPVAATRMACPEAVLDQESAWFAFLESVVRYEHTAEGLLLLYPEGGGPPARMSPMELAGG